MTEAAEPRPKGSLVSDYEYDLPPGRVARYPADQRDESRLLVVDRSSEEFGHLRFKELPQLFQAGDLLIVNESRVLPVRLLGRKPTGAPSEIFLLRPVASAPEGRPRTRPPTGLICCM